MPPGLKNAGLLNGKECWKDWTVNLGTLSAVQRKLEQEGRVNPRTGLPPTASAIQKSAYTWAVANMEEARKDLEWAWSKAGQPMTDEAWKRFITKAASLIYYQRPRKYERFVAQYNLQQFM